MFIITNEYGIILLPCFNLEVKTNFPHLICLQFYGYPPLTLQC